MPRRALIENRPWLLLGIALALSFWMVSGSAVGELYQMALKGGSVAALAIYAFLNGQGRNALLVALVMALGAAGDIGMELDTVTGGAFFAAAHIVAIALYLLNPRARGAAPARLLPRRRLRCWFRRSPGSSAATCSPASTASLSA